MHPCRRGTPLRLSASGRGTYWEEPPSGVSKVHPRENSRVVNEVSSTKKNRKMQVKAACNVEGFCDVVQHSNRARRAKTVQTWSSGPPKEACCSCKYAS